MSESAHVDSHHCPTCNDVREFTTVPDEGDVVLRCKQCGKEVGPTQFAQAGEASVIDALRAVEELGQLTNNITDEDEQEARLNKMREPIVREVRRRVRWFANDCMTFRRVRFELPDWWKQNAADHDSIGPGGGNHMIALATLTVCNFLAKAHAILRKPDIVATQQDVENVKETIIFLKESPEAQQLRPGLKKLLKDSHTRWIPPAQGSCNELDAFVKMVRALKEDDIDLGLPGESAEYVWRRFRNRIAHMAHPDGVSAVYAPERATTSEESEARIRQSGPAFQKVEGDWQCRVDRFALDIRDIGEWLPLKSDTFFGEKK